MDLRQAQVFVQITKVDEAKRLVYGRAAEEVIDRSGEVFDYASSKPYFEAWSAEVQKDSGGKSLGNVRSMHGNVAAGKLVDMQFLDDDRAIDVTAKVVDDNEWRKVLEGVHTGFSIGGSYVDRKTEMVDGKEIKRYTANPNEISLVDRPCIPTAKFFDVLKADGSVQHVAFKSEDPAKDTIMTPGEQEYEVTGSDADVEALSKFMNEQSLSVADVLAFAKALAPARDMVVESPVELRKADGTPHTPAEVRKYLTTAAEFAYCVQCVHMLHKRVTAENEAIHVDLLNNLKACMFSLADCMKQFVDEEVTELKSGKEEAEVMTAVSPQLMAMAERLGDMTKGDPTDSLLTLVKYGARNNKMDQDRIQKIHDATVELMAKCGVPVKAAADGDLAKGGENMPPASAEEDGKAGKPKDEAGEPKDEDEAGQPKGEGAAAPEQSEGADEPVQKALQAAVAPLQKAVESLQKQLSEATEKLAKLEAQPAPSRVRLRAVAKGEDLAGADKDETPVAPVTSQGQVNEAATMIKAVHSTGGRPYLRKDS